MDRLVIAIAVAAAPATASAQSPWNGDWTLDAARSSAVAKDGAADGYEFTIAGERIRWEIPSLGEVGDGRLDGVPFALRRSKEKGARMTLAVRAEGLGVLIYAVARNGRPLGDGRMTLVDGGSAWVGLTHKHGSPFWGAQVTYVRKSGSTGTARQGTLRADASSPITAAARRAGMPRA